MTPSDRVWHEYLKRRDNAAFLIDTGLESLGYKTCRARLHGNNAVFWLDDDRHIHDVQIWHALFEDEIVIPRIHIDRCEIKVSDWVCQELGFSLDQRPARAERSLHQTELTIAMSELLSMALWVPSLIAFRDGKRDYARPPSTVYDRTGPGTWTEQVPLMSYAWTIKASNAYARVHGIPAISLIERKGFAYPS